MCRPKVSSFLIWFKSRTDYLADAAYADTCMHMHILAVYCTFVFQVKPHLVFAVMRWLWKKEREGDVIRTIEQRWRELVMHSFTFAPSFSGLQMILKSQLVCLEKQKVCW